jgi:hypothetical protein
MGVKTDSKIITRSHKSKPLRHTVEITLGTNLLTKQYRNPVFQLLLLPF